ncbi:MAG: tRNA glutamyl-Q(34) synthetase GluQRS [Zetaproteobacteria bacterium]|nr:tRNA glutamyl-Q(34) synthetase GluQRS [Zetaproteobacteria bacterium]
MRTRFAPSPSGLLHIGNAYSALICQQWQQHNHAELLLRIEDIDHNRCKPEWITAIFEDLEWLGIPFSTPILQQSLRTAHYQYALDQLQNLGVIYACNCTRKSIQAEIERMGVAPHLDDPHIFYPGTCREQHKEETANTAWRLNIEKAHALLNAELSWKDECQHYPVNWQQQSDPVIGRKDIGFSYHLASVVDDAEQQITHIIRGEDLRPFAPLHRILQSLLQLPEPTYIHHPILCDMQGNRLCKRHHAPTLQSLRQQGQNVQQLRERLYQSMANHLWNHGDFYSAIAD